MLFFFEISDVGNEACLYHWPDRVTVIPVSLPISSCTGCLIRQFCLNCSSGRRLFAILAFSRSLLHVHLTSHASYSCLSCILLCFIPSGHWCRSPSSFSLSNRLLDFCFVLLHFGTPLFEPRVCTAPSKQLTQHNIALICDHHLGSLSPILPSALVALVLASSTKYESEVDKRLLSIFSY